VGPANDGRRKIRKSPIRPDHRFRGRSRWLVRTTDSCDGQRRSGCSKFKNRTSHERSTSIRRLLYSRRAAVVTVLRYNRPISRTKTKMIVSVSFIGKKSLYWFITAVPAVVKSRSRRAQRTFAV